MTVDEQRMNDLEQSVRELNRMIVGMQNILRIAGEYKSEDPQKILDAIQAMLKKAAEYQPRPQRRGRR